MFRVLAATVVLAISVQLTLSITADAGSTPPRNFYIALGDSYSAGEGLSPVLPTPTGCDDAPLAFPEIVKQRLGFTNFRFVACSGATSAQVDSQLSLLSSKLLKRAKLTTLTAGGDDLPFSGLVGACLGLTTSPPSATFTYIRGRTTPTGCAAEINRVLALLGASVDPATGNITPPSTALASPLTRPSTIESRLLELYIHVLRTEGAITRLRIGPRLIVEQYPTILGNIGTDNCILAATSLQSTTFPAFDGLYPAFTASVATELEQVNSLLQEEIAAVVADVHRFGYLGVSVATSGSSFAPIDCQVGGSADLNGLVLNATTGLPVNNSFHPTAAGQLVLAHAIIVAWKTPVQ
ncbi:MAG: hypothetical protein ACRDVC_03755 [Acidimicrobiales bacterium]